MTVPQNLITNAIDLHVHIGPEIIPRRFTVEQLISEQTGKIAGMALKNHFYPTTPLIASCTQSKNLMLIGSVTLNQFVGGLNADAIYANSLLSPFPTIVWLPTIHAAQFLKSSEYEIAPEWVAQPSKNKMRKSANITPVKLRNIAQVLTAIKETDAILATGHISWQASQRIVTKASLLGINRIIITHPIYQRIDMPISIQQLLAKKGAYIEQCYSMYAIDKVPIENIVLQIKAVGAQSCMVSSDSGQSFSPPPSVALYQFATKLNALGISEKELEVMLITNPRKLIAPER